MGSVNLLFCTHLSTIVTVMPSKGSKGSSKKAKKSGSNVFDTFTRDQVSQFKDGFQIMDRDRDGILNKGDLRGVFDEIGRLATEDELDVMLAESEAPINFTTFLSMFAAKSTGEVDEAFEAFDDYFDEDTGMFEASGIIEMLVGAD